MILCVTLNPCLDKTLTVPAWQPGDIVRGQSVGEVVGGKGNNVARALRALARPARPVTFLGGATGRRCADLLRGQDGFEPLVVESESSTRVILTVRTEGTDAQTAFMDPDPAISEVEAGALLETVEGVLVEGGIELVTLSGSSPAATTDHLYSDLIALARRHRVPAMLDTYGRALESIWGFWPDVIQLNRREAAGALGAAPATVGEAELLGLLMEWSRHGVGVGVVTDGPDPALAVVGEACYRVWPVEQEPDEVVNPIGSGDSFLAGLADGYLQKLEPEPLLQRAVACAISNLRRWDAGSVDASEVAELMPQVRVERIEEAVPETARLGLNRHVPVRRR